MFKDAATPEDHINPQEYTSSVTSDISKCVDVLVVNKDGKTILRPESLRE